MAGSMHSAKSELTMRIFDEKQEENKGDESERIEFKEESTDEARKYSL